MVEFLSPALCFCVFISIIVSSTAQTCSSYAFTSNNRVFKSCNDLSVLGSFLHYNYDDETGKVEIAYRHSGLSSRKWVAWGINPTSTGMVGSQAIIAYQQTDGTMRVYTSPITTYQTQLQEGSLSFDVSGLSATYENNEIIIFATLGISNITGMMGTGRINYVWQDGLLSGDMPQPHTTSGPNVQSMATLNLLSGQIGSAGGPNSKIKKRNIHGVLNAVSWGIMMPVGAMVARYMKVFKSANPAWFYFHAFCQSSAYIIGVSGWAIGLKLGADSPGIQYNTHRAIGIALFCLATLQVFALLVRPKPNHKHRLYWNIYHHSIGYAVIILGIVNIFKGLEILSPKKEWKNAYIGVIVALVIVAVIMEAFTWFVVIKRKKSEATPKTSYSRNGVSSNGA